jgi:hypothetical protein
MNVRNPLIHSAAFVVSQSRLPGLIVYLGDFSHLMHLGIVDRRVRAELGVDLSFDLTRNKHSRPFTQRTDGITRGIHVASLLGHVEADRSCAVSVATRLSLIRFHTRLVINSLHAAVEVGVVVNVADVTVKAEVRIGVKKPLGHW